MQNIIVALDLSPKDNFIISFLSKFTQHLEIKNLDFIHVKQESNGNEPKIPDENLIKELKNKIDKKVKNVDYKINISAGDPSEQIKNISAKEKTDLLILGHSKSNKKENAAQEIVNEPTSSLLLVPQISDFKISKIYVALDFSDICQYALKQAHLIASAIDAKLVGVHSYQVPVGYHVSGKDHREYAKTMESNAKDEAKEFLKKANIDDVDIEYLYDEKKKPAKTLIEHIRNKKSDLLVLGSKGKTDAASIIVGSVAEELIDNVYDMPILITKDKTKDFDIGEAIKEV